MHTFSSSSVLLGSSILLSSFASAAPRTFVSQGGHATCMTESTPVKVTSPNNIKLHTELPANQFALTQSIVSLISAGIGPKLTEKILGKPHSVSGDFKISTTFCVPKKGGDDSKAVQILTHGIGFDHGYWDFAPGYSYVDVAAQNGASTLSYDRLGVGKSSTPGGEAPIQVVQAPMEVAIKHELISKLRAGDFGGKPCSKVVAVGHSFGSAVSVGLANSHPSDADAIVLTGFTLNSTGIPFFQTALAAQFARTAAPKRFGGLNNGYILSGDAMGDQVNFFHYPGFTAAIARAAEKVKQTVTIGELLTLSGVVKPAPKYTGAVSVVNGAYDIPFCTGNCHYPSDLGKPVPSMLFPKAEMADTRIFPNSGHGINLHKVAPDVFKYIQGFIESAGL